MGSYENKESSRCQDCGTPTKKNHSGQAVPAQERVQMTRLDLLVSPMFSEGWIHVQDMIFGVIVVCLAFGIRNVYSVYFESMLSDL